MDGFINILIIVLMFFLIFAQILLAVRQIQKKAPDGKILLTINLAVLTVWIPLCICKYIFSGFSTDLSDLSALDLIWYLFAVCYMAFTVWYTKMLGKSGR